MHELTRPVARLTSLSTYAELTARAAELRRAGHECAKIADILNSEGWRPAKRRDTFNAQMVHHLLIKSGAETLKYRRRQPPGQQRPSWPAQQFQTVLPSVAFAGAPTEQSADVDHAAMEPA